MEILINELSLNGQFDTEDKFLDNLQDILRIFKLIEISDFTLLKNSMLFDVEITSNYKMVELLTLKTDKIRKSTKNKSIKLTHTALYRGRFEDENE